MSKDTILDTNVPSINKQWQLYLQRCGIKESAMSTVQHSEMKKAFFGACIQTMISLRDDVSAYPEDKSIAILEAMMDEISDYFAEEVKRYDGGGPLPGRTAKPTADVREALVSAKGDLSPLARKIRKLIRQQYGVDGSAFVIVFTHPEHDEMTHFATNIDRADAASLLAEMAQHIRSGLN